MLKLEGIEVDECEVVTIEHSPLPWVPGTSGVFGLRTMPA